MPPTIPSCNYVDIGEWTRKHTLTFLRPPGEPMSFNHATPRAIMLLIEQLEVLTNRAEVEINSIPPGVYNTQQQQLLAELQAWDVKLARYRELTVGAIEAEQGPAEIWHCVTVPLLLGIEPNADCTGPKLPEFDGPADVRIPLQLLNGANCLVEAENDAVAAAVDLHWTEIAEALKNAGESAYEGAKAVVEGISDAVLGSVKSPWSGLAGIGALSIVGVAAYFILRR